MVGHSLGGELVMRYAWRYPQDVAGLVLVDPPPPDGRNIKPPEMAKLQQELNEKRPKQLEEWFDASCDWRTSPDAQWRVARRSDRTAATQYLSSLRRLIFRSSP